MQNNGYQKETSKFLIRYILLSLFIHSLGFHYYYYWWPYGLFSVGRLVGWLFSVGRSFDHIGSGGGGSGYCCHHWFPFELDRSFDWLVCSMCFIVIIIMINESWQLWIWTVVASVMLCVCDEWPCCDKQHWTTTTTKTTTETKQYFWGLFFWLTIACVCVFGLGFGGKKNFWFDLPVFFWSWVDRLFFLFSFFLKAS